jgi:hypothetical protein
MKTRFLAVLALCVMVLLSGVAPAAARQKKKAQANPYAMQVTELRAIRLVLQNAKHDYKGHRAKAVKLVTTAIKSLLPAGKGTGKGAPKGKGGSKGGSKETQQQSDAQLQKAIVALGAVQKQLTSGPAAATAAITQAINELNIALTIK